MNININDSNMYISNVFLHRDTTYVGAEVGYHFFYLSAECRI